MDNGRGAVSARLKCFTTGRYLVVPKLTLIREGETEVYVPSESLASAGPATHPVFFNPAARINRDISVAVAASTRPLAYLDVLAGTGGTRGEDRK